VGLDVDDAVEEVRLAMLAAEVLSRRGDCQSASFVYMTEVGVTISDGNQGREKGLVAGRRRFTLLIMSPWLARWVLHVLQP
jgi:hypothetical protein